jgi:hypothetical protein
MVVALCFQWELGFVSKKRLLSPLFPSRLPGTLVGCGFVGKDGASVLTFAWGEWVMRQKVDKPFVLTVF